jgi:NAD(P)-dependent dehydrogenase (short-subunit alcohol dehydrogenase family)
MWQLLLEVLAAAAAAADGKRVVAAASRPPVAAVPLAALCPAAAAAGGHTPEVHSAVRTCQVESRCFWWVVQLFRAWVAQLGDSSELLSQALL